MRGTVCSTDITDESQESLCPYTKNDKSASFFVLCQQEFEWRSQHMLQLTLGIVNVFVLLYRDPLGVVIVYGRCRVTSGLLCRSVVVTLWREETICKSLVSVGGLTFDLTKTNCRGNSWIHTIRCDREYSCLEMDFIKGEVISWLSTGGE